VIRSIIFLLVPASALFSQSQVLDLRSAGVNDIQAAVASGALTYERLVQLYLNRIEAYDKSGPRLKEETFSVRLA
jgi:amidase